MLLLVLRLFLYRSPEFHRNRTVRVTGRVTNLACQTVTKCSFFLGKVEIFIKALTPLACGQKIAAVGNLQGQVTEGRLTSFYLSDPKILILAESDSRPVWVRGRCWLEGIRNRLLDLNRQVMTGLPLTVVNGVSWGRNADIQPEFLRQLRSTGTFHLLVASGYNLTVVFGAVYAFFGAFWRRYWVDRLVLVVIWGYVFLAGGEPSLVRAGLMATVILLAGMVGRRRFSWWSLALSAYLMVLVSPGLATDLSFQFSFLATAGLLYGQCFFPRKSRLQKAAEPFLVGFWAQVAILPVVWQTFHQFFLISLVSGPLLGLLIEPLTVGGFILPFFGLAAPQLARVILFPLWLLAKLFIAGVSFFGQLPGGVIRLNSLSWPLVIGYYLFWIILGKRRGVWGRREEK